MTDTIQPARVFECLEGYGFETPDELRQYIDGTHPMYSEEGCRQLMAENGKAEEGANEGTR